MIIDPKIESQVAEQDINIFNDNNSYKDHNSPGDALIYNHDQVNYDQTGYIDAIGYQRQE